MPFKIFVAVLAFLAISYSTSAASIESSMAIVIDENGDEKTLYEFMKTMGINDTNAEKVETKSSGLCVADTNQQRRNNGRNSDFQNHNQIVQAAKNHNDYMIAHDCFSHRCEGEKGLGDRVTDSGYRWRGIAENIAAGQANCPEVVRAWMNSDGHKRNILSDNIHIGCAYGTCNNCRYRTYWTCVYARN